MSKVSVIIAVYNVEKYLEKCLQSLVNQTLEDIEIIVVNDGSTDSSQDIIDRFVAYSPKVKALVKENGGASDARNYGMQYASGEYIGFVDSDDFVDANMYEVMYQKALEEGSDIVECNLRHTYTDTEDIEIMDRYYDKKELLMFGHYVVWNKIYKTQWLRECEAYFPVNLIYEDVAFLATITPYIHKYSYVDIAPVHYVQRLASVNNSTSLKTMDILKILTYIYQYYEEHDWMEQYEQELEYLYIRILLCSSFSRMCHMENKDNRKKALRENWNLLVTTWPNWKKNKTLKTINSHQGLFMRTMNGVTYRIYSKCFPVLYSIKSKGTNMCR